MEKTELVRKVEERVDEELLQPVRRAMGDGTPAERTALEVIRIMAEAEHELASRWIDLQEAVERSGYSYDTVVHYAKAIVDGESVPEPWASMEVRREEGRPYEVQAGTVPMKPGAVA